MAEDKLWYVARQGTKMKAFATEQEAFDWSDADQTIALYRQTDKGLLFVKVLGLKTDDPGKYFENG